MNDPIIRHARQDDTAAIVAIYNHYVLETCVSFEVEPVSISDMAQRMSAVALPWLVAEQSGQVLGYAYAAPWRARYAYRYSVESSVYLDASHQGKGLGRQLYAALIDKLRVLSLHCVIGGVALPNATSIALHEGLGFKKVAHFQRVGFKHDRWIDVGYWQLILERQQGTEETSAPNLQSQSPDSEVMPNRYSEAVSASPSTPRNSD